MGIGGKQATLVLELASVTASGREVLGQIVVPSALAMHFSKEGTHGVRADWQATLQGKPPEKIASAQLPDAPGIKGSL